MLNSYVREFLDFECDEPSLCMSDVGNYTFNSLNDTIIPKIKHLKLLCKPNYFYPKKLTIDKFCNLEILDIVNFSNQSIQYVLENMKKLSFLKIVRMKNTVLLDKDILPDSIETVIIDDICSEYSNINRIHFEKLNFGALLSLRVVPVRTKQIILNLNHNFTNKLFELQLLDKFLEKFIDFLRSIEIPPQCKIVLNGIFI
jgi:hypothetical protein